LADEGSADWLPVAKRVLTISQQRWGYSQRSGGERS
jgi:hypothetical protein